MGGGPDKRQLAAADAQTALTKQETQIAGAKNSREEDQYQTVKPFLLNRLQNGLPYFNMAVDSVGGPIARGYQPAYARIARQDSGGTADAQIRALDADKARTFSDSLLQLVAQNDQAKVDAATGITQQQQIANPAAFFGLANQGNNAVMNAPLASPGVGGIIGGIAGGLLSNPNLGKKGGIPF